MSYSFKAYPDERSVDSGMIIRLGEAAGLQSRSVSCRHINFEQII